MAGSKYSGKRASGAPPAVEPMPAERAEIIAWMKKVRFRHRIFGGVDERTVWRRISELDALYTKALEAERVRCNALIEAARNRPPPATQTPEGGGDPSG